MHAFEVETRIGRGAQHIVGKLANGKIIKWPHWRGRRWDKSTAKSVQEDLDSHKDLGTPIPETIVVPKPIIDDGRSIYRPPYAILSEEVKGRVFREIDLSADSVRDQITDLTGKSISHRRQSGNAIDFLGKEAYGQFISYLFKEKKTGRLGAYNIIIDSRDRLRLIDTNLLNPSRAPLGVGWIISSSIDLQHTLMSILLQQRDLIDACLKDNNSPTVTKAAQKMYDLSRKIEKKRSET